MLQFSEQVVASFEESRRINKYTVVESYTVLKPAFIHSIKELQPY